MTLPLPVYFILSGEELLSPQLSRCPLRRRKQPNCIISLYHHSHTPRCPELLVVPSGLPAPDWPGLTPHGSVTTVIIKSLEFIKVWIHFGILRFHELCVKEMINKHSNISRIKAFHIHNVEASVVKSLYTTGWWPQYGTLNQGQVSCPWPLTCDVHLPEPERVPVMLASCDPGVSGRHSNGPSAVLIERLSDLEWSQINQELRSEVRIEVSRNRNGQVEELNNLRPWLWWCHWEQRSGSIWWRCSGTSGPRAAG